MYENRLLIMKNLILFTAALFFVHLTMQGQVPKGMGKSDPKGKAVLDAVSKRFKTFKNVQAKFNLKIENASGKVMGTKAGMVYMKGTKYRVSLPDQEIFSDGNKVWTYDSDANEVTISKLDPEANSITPQKLFTNFYDKDFLYKLNGETKVGTKMMQEIELTPVDKTKPFFKVLLYVNNNIIYLSKVFEKTGNRYTYSISNLNTTSAVSDAMFIFDAKKFPDVEVIDLL